MRLLACLLSALMCLPASSTWAAALPQAPGFLNVLAAPLPKASENLLYRNRYQIRADGTVWSPDGVTQIETAELPNILRRLGSNQRLKALVQIDLVLSNSAGEKYLTPAEYEEIKKVSRENWAFFTLSLRKQFKRYFDGEELETLDRDPAPLSVEEMEAAPLKDMEPEVAVAAEPCVPPAEPSRRASLGASPLPPLLKFLPSTVPQPEAVAAAPAAPAAAPSPTIIYVPVPSTGFDPKSLIPQPAAAPAQPPAQIVHAPPPETAPAKPVEPVVVAAAAPVLKPVIPVAPAAANDPYAGLSMPPAVRAELEKKPVAPAPVEKKIEARPEVVAAKPEPLPPPPPKASPLVERPAVAPAVTEIMQAEFERWLADAPYGREAKAMLRLISEKSPDFARSRVLNTILSTMPMIVIDSERAGADRYGAIIVEQKSGETGYTIALSPGPAFYTKKRMLFGSTTILLSDSQAAFSAMHLPVPTVGAIQRDAVAVKEDQTDWGRTRSYADGSTRSYYTYQQMAGTLLRELLLLDAQRQGWSMSRFAAEVYARSAQNMFYARMTMELGDDRYLDPDTRSQFHGWLSHPRDWHDELAHTLSAARGGGIAAGLSAPDTSSEFVSSAQGSCPGSYEAELSRPEIARRAALKASAADLQNMKLIEKDALASAQKAVDAEPAPAAPPQGCAPYWENAAKNLSAAAGLLSELRQGEARFRMELASQGSHAK